MLEVARNADRDEQPRCDRAAVQADLPVRRQRATLADLARPAHRGARKVAECHDLVDGVRAPDLRSYARDDVGCVEAIRRELGRRSPLDELEARLTGKALGRGPAR